MPSKLQDFDCTRGIHKASLVSCHASRAAIDARYEVARAIDGKFGCAHLVLERPPPQTAASGMQQNHQAPRLRLAFSTAELKPALVQQMRSEIHALSTLDHPCIVRLLECAEDLESGHLTTVLEHVPGKPCSLSLATHRDQGGFGDLLASQISRQLFAALAHCHAHGVIHRNVSPSSLMLTRSSTCTSPQCKLVDFGMALFTGSCAHEFHGPAGYLAPEIVLKQTVHSAEADVWAAAVTSFEIMTAQSLFGTGDEHGEITESVFERIQLYAAGDGGRLEELLQRLKLATSCRCMPTKEAQDFLWHALQPNPQNRPTAREASNHKWMKQQQALTVGFASDIIGSMTDYIGASPMARCCAFLLATRTLDQSFEQLRVVFMEADADNDGVLSSEDLANAFDAASALRLPAESSKRFADTLVQAADLSHSGHLTYTEFLAAAGYRQLGLNDVSNRGNVLPPVITSQLHRVSCRIFKKAFEVLDSDHDGLVQIWDVLALFRLRDSEMLLTLPQDRPFNLQEWLSCLGSEDIYSSATQAHASLPRVPLAALNKGRSACAPRKLADAIVPAEDMPPFLESDYATGLQIGASNLASLSLSRSLAGDLASLSLSRSGAGDICSCLGPDHAIGLHRCAARWGCASSPKNFFDPIGDIASVFRALLGCNSDCSTVDVGDVDEDMLMLTLPLPGISVHGRPTVAI